jgi:hypothetical protein|tara:strand:+ start:416 stop:595 length:180 start_codon:yes stop_codon:yes gene_type:complete
MTKKDLKKVEEIVEKVLYDMAHDSKAITLQGDEEVMFSLAILEEMEDYLGHPIGFMGIS